MSQIARPQPPLRWPVASLLGALLLVGCGATTNTSSSDSTSSTTSVTDPITFQTTTMPVGYLGEPFSSNIAVLGGVGPYGYRIVSGTLPPGIKLSGTSLSGTPTTAGAYQFTVEASDANLSTRVKQYTLNVNDLPPLSLEPELPTGQVRGETRVPIKIKAARKVRATRLVWDLGKDVKVTRVQATDPTNTLMWSQDGQVVTVDLGYKTAPRSDTRVALLTVKPAQPTTLTANNFWYESRDGAGKLLSGKKRPSSAETAPKASTTSPATPASAKPATTPAAKPVPTPAGTSPAAPQPAAPGKTSPTPPAPNRPLPTPGTGTSSTGTSGTGTSGTASPTPGTSNTGGVVK